jgi:1,2-diacylglycerol 3-alpha-glucosyltransferase
MVGLSIIELITINMQTNASIKKITRLKPYLRAFFFIFSVGLGLIVSFITLREDLTQFNWQTFIETSADWIERWPMMLIAFTLLLVVILTSGLRLHLLISTKLKRHRFLDSLMFGILARYYVLITPWGLGGQPIVMAMMYKKNIPLGLATSAPMLDLLMMRLAMFVFVLVGLIGFGYLVDPLLYLLAWIGFFFTCFVPVIMIMVSFHPFFSQLLIDIVSWFIPAKKKVNFQANLKQTLTQYREAFSLFKKRPFSFFFVAFFALVSQFALLAIPYFIIASFNLAPFDGSNITFNLLNVLMMMSFANTILGTVPTLGSAGAAEFTFTTVFSTFISGNVLFWATFLWRFLLFYLWLLMGIVISLAQGIFAKREYRRHHLPNPQLPLKVFIFNDGFFPLIDGVVRAVDGYATYLVSQGIDVTVVVPSNAYNHQEYPYKILPIPQVKIPGFFYPLPYGIHRRKIREALYYDGPTIYHAHTPFLLGHLALELSRQFHFPLVTTFHSKYYDDYYATTKNRFISNILKRLTINYFKQSQAIWTVSPATIKTIRSYGLKHRSIQVIPNGTNITPQIHSKTNIKTILKQFNLDENMPTLLYVGQLIWQKNIKLMLDTYEALEKLGFEFQAIFVGDGRNQKDIIAECSEKKFKSKILFTGKISDKQTLSGLYAFADLFFFPSSYDTDGIVIKEAAAHELPALVLAKTSASQIIIDQSNGFIQAGGPEKFARRIIEIFSQTIILKEVGIQAKKSIVLRWDDTLKNLVELYQKVIEDFYST